MVGDILDLAASCDVVAKSGAWYAYEGNKIGQGRENAKKFIAENPDIQKVLEEKIMENAQKLAYSGDDDENPSEAGENTAESAAQTKAEAPAESEAPKAAPKKSKSKKSVVVDADDDFEEFSLDEMGE